MGGAGLAGGRGQLYAKAAQTCTMPQQTLHTSRLPAKNVTGNASPTTTPRGEGSRHRQGGLMWAWQTRLGLIVYIDTRLHANKIMAARQEVGKAASRGKNQPTGTHSHTHPYNYYCFDFPG